MTVPPPPPPPAWAHLRGSQCTDGQKTALQNQNLCRASDEHAPLAGGGGSGAAPYALDAANGSAVVVRNDGDAL